ncbi:MAG: riboflavin synthase, partial [Gemmatimonadales bacterium]
MFTGLIDSVGDITVVKQTSAGVEITVGCRYHDLVEGESIAINGTCLTVREFGDGWFSVGAVVTTTGRTTIADWKPGRRVNIERAMRADGRLGGHIVQGHVDAVANVTGSAQVGDAFLIDIELPMGLSETLVLRGSVTID